MIDNWDATIAMELQFDNSLIHVLNTLNSHYQLGLYIRIGCNQHVIDVAWYGYNGYEQYYRFQPGYHQQTNDGYAQQSDGFTSIATMMNGYPDNQTYRATANVELIMINLLMARILQDTFVHLYLKWI